MEPRGITWGLDRRFGIPGLARVVEGECGLPKAQAMSDLEKNAWQHFICIESSNVSRFAVDLEPGQQHIMKTSVSVFDY